MNQSIKTSITIYGTVQGVGFRPFVYRLAKEMGLSGMVSNRGGYVSIEIYDNPDLIECFIQRLREEAPPLSAVKQIEVRQSAIGAPTPTDFSIQPSVDSVTLQVEIPTDTATCQDCLNELWDVSDRRYRYPFINCTNCGPRFTVIKSLPYDRTSTTVDCFPMCQACRHEYEAPDNRRFHAQPIACFECGPRLFYLKKGETLSKALI
ncbi:MAG: acylphosphatase, partial [Cyanobacteria bacterium]|nr:acylphosphatase [Cyanobacteriota bacterium]